MRKKHIEEIRAFNRFYTGVIGLLDNYILNSHFTLPEVRILFELYHNERITASDLISSLHIDKGYLSRILKQFEKRKMIEKVSSKTDKRSAYIKLTHTGKKEFEVLNQESNNQIAGIINQITNDECERLIDHMKSIKTILNRLRI